MSILKLLSTSGSRKNDEGLYACFVIRISLLWTARLCEIKSNNGWRYRALSSSNFIATRDVQLPIENRQSKIN